MLKYITESLRTSSFASSSCFSTFATICFFSSETNNTKELLRIQINLIFKNFYFCIPFSFLVNQIRELPHQTNDHIILWWVTNHFKPLILGYLETYNPVEYLVIKRCHSILKRNQKLFCPLGETVSITAYVMVT